MFRHRENSRSRHYAFRSVAGCALCLAIIVALNTSGILAAARNSQDTSESAPWLADTAALNAHNAAGLVAIGVAEPISQRHAEEEEGEEEGEGEEAGDEGDEGDEGAEGEDDGEDGSEDAGGSAEEGESDGEDAGGSAEEGESDGEDGDEGEDEGESEEPTVQPAEDSDSDLTELDTEEAADTESMTEEESVVSQETLESETSSSEVTESTQSAPNVGATRRSNPARGTASNAAETPAVPDHGPYQLEYRFTPGEEVRWTVTHQMIVRTSIANSTQTAETMSRSVKVWKIKEVKEDGSVVLVNTVDSVFMSQKTNDHDEVTYDSTQGGEPPSAFKVMANLTGKPLCQITIDQTGKLLDREILEPQPTSANETITVPLPSEPIDVGASWAHPYDVEVTPKGGRKTKIKTRQMFRLEEVTGGVATISVETKILTPIHDPSIEAQLIERYSRGLIRFDIAQGRILSQRTDLDKSVIGFHGEASSLHYRTQFEETLMVGGEPTPPATSPATDPETVPSASNRRPNPASARRTRPRTAAGPAPPPK